MDPSVDVTLMYCIRKVHNECVNVLSICQNDSNKIRNIVSKGPFTPNGDFTETQIDALTYMGVVICDGPITFAHRL